MHVARSFMSSARMTSVGNPYCSTHTAKLANVVGDIDCISIASRNGAGACATDGMCATRSGRLCAETLRDIGGDALEVKLLVDGIRFIGILFQRGKKSIIIFSVLCSYVMGWRCSNLRTLFVINGTCKDQI